MPPAQQQADDSQTAFSFGGNPAEINYEYDEGSFRDQNGCNNQYQGEDCGEDQNEQEQYQSYGEEQPPNNYYQDDGQGEGEYYEEDAYGYEQEQLETPV